MAEIYKAFYGKLGGSVGDVGEMKYGFYAPADAYTGIADELGIAEVTSSVKNVAFGINTPKLPRVRINFLRDELVGADARGSCVRFCDPDKLGTVLGGSLVGKAIKVNGKAAKIKNATPLG